MIQILTSHFSLADDQLYEQWALREKSWMCKQKYFDLCPRHVLLLFNVLLCDLEIWAIQKWNLACKISIHWVRGRVLTIYICCFSNYQNNPVGRCENLVELELPKCLGISSWDLPLISGHLAIKDFWIFIWPTDFLCFGGLGIGQQMHSKLYALMYNCTYNIWVQPLPLLADELKWAFFY